VRTDLRIAVIAAPDSAAASAARKAGATLVGEDIIFDAVKEGRIELIDVSAIRIRCQSLRRLDWGGYWVRGS